MNEKILTQHYYKQIYIFIWCWIGMFAIHLCSYIVMFLCYYGNVEWLFFRTKMSQYHLENLFMLLLCMLVIYYVLKVFLPNVRSVPLYKTIKLYI